MQNILCFNELIVCSAFLGSKILGAGAKALFMVKLHNFTLYRLLVFHKVLH